MGFTINDNLRFIDSMRFMNSSLDALVKSFSDNDFKYLSQEFSGDLLELVKQKGVHPYENIDNFKTFCDEKKKIKKIKKILLKTQVIKNMLMFCLIKN